MVHYFPSSLHPHFLAWAGIALPDDVTSRRRVGSPLHRVAQFDLVVCPVPRYQDSVLEAFASDLPLDCPNSTMVTAELVYPDLQEPSPLLRRAVGNARSAGGGKGLESIVAARDFMTFPVQLRRQGAK
jgi:hypothetical protein